MRKAFEEDLSKELFDLVDELDLCPFWCIFGQCINRNDIEPTPRCKHGVHTKSIATEMKKRNFHQALQFSKYFLHVLDEDINPNRRYFISMKNRLNLLGHVYNHLADLAISGDRKHNCHINYKLADEYLEKAVQVNPEYYPRLIYYAKFLTIHFNDDTSREKAYKLYKSVALSNPNHAGYNYMLAMALRENFNEYDESICYFEKTLKLESNSFRTLFEYAFALYKKGIESYPKALKMYEKVVERYENGQFIHDSSRITSNPQQANNTSKKMIKRIEQALQGVTVAETSSIDIDITNTSFMFDTAVTKLSALGVEWSLQRRQTHFNQTEQDDTAIIYTDFDEEGKISECEYKDLMRKLIEDGYDNKTKNDFKLRLYNFSIENVKKYYDIDRFCHDLCILNECNNIDQCSFQHCFSIAQLIDQACNMDIHSKESITKVKEALLLTKYMLFHYTKNNEKFKHDQSQDYLLIVAFINQYLGDIYRITAQNRNDFINAEKFYDRSYQIFNSSECFVDRNIAHARVLDQGLGNWGKAKVMYEAALCKKNGFIQPYAVYSFAVASSFRNELTNAIKYFKKAIQLKEPRGRDNGLARYYYEYGFTLFKTKDVNYLDESLSMFKKAIEIVDANGKNGNGSDRIRRKANARIAELEVYRSNINIDINMNINRETSLSLIAKKNQTSHVVNHDDNYNYNDDDDDDESKDGVDKVNCDYQFNHFWKQLEFKFGGQLETDKYYENFCSKYYNHMSIVCAMNEKILKIDIGMNQYDCQYFLKKIKHFNLQRDKFVAWLKHNKLYDSYIVQFSKYSIYTMESLKMFIHQYPKDWHDKIMKSQATNDCFEIDAKIVRNLLQLV